MRINNAIELWTSNPEWSITLRPTETDLEFMYVNFNDVEFQVPVAGLSEIIWSPPPELFSEGVNTVSIRYDDFAKNPGISTVFTLNLDTTAPNQPRILYAADDVGSNTSIVGPDGRTDDPSPVLTGLAEKNSLVTLYNAQDEPIGSAYANEDGLWEIEADLAEGVNQLYVTAKDRFDHVSVPSEPFNIAIGPDIAPPAPGVALITHAWDDAGTVATGRLESGALTDDTTPTLHGTAPANGTVEIQYRTLNGSWISGGSVTALADGSWNWKAPELADGSWEFRVGNGSWSSEFALEIDATPLDRIAITHAWDDEGPYPGPLGSGAVTDDHTPTFHGRAEANSLVYVHYRSAGGGWTRLGSALAGPDGNWTLTSSMLPNGDYEFTAGGSSTSPGSNPPLFSLTLVDDDAASPQITGIYDDFGGSTGYLHEPRQTDDRTPRLEGRAPVGSLVVIYQNGAPVGSMLAENGLWQFDVPALTEGGTYRFSSAIRDASGNTGPRSEAWEMELLVEQPDPMIITFSGMTADSGTSASDWITNDGSANRTVSGTLSRTLAQGETLLVYNGLEWLRAAVNGLTWTLVDPAAHSSSWRYEAYVENAIFGTELGNIRQSVTFDNAIVKPTISGAYDDSGSGEQLIPPDGSTTDSTPLLRGTAESGSMVYIYREGTDAPIGSVKAENGRWEFITNQLKLDNNIFHVHSVDIAGNNVDSDKYNIKLIPQVLVKTDFDDRTWQGWQLSPPYKDGYSGYTATKRAYFGTTGRVDYNNDVIYREIEVVTGKTYRFKFDAMDYLTGQNRAKVGMKVGGAWIIPATTLGSDLQIFEGTYTATTTGKVRVAIANTTATGEGNDFSVDNIEIVALPPTTSNHIEKNVIQADTNTETRSNENVDGMHTVSNDNGTDTLIITGAQQTLVLSDVADKLNSVEVIDITGSGDNRLALNVGDVLDHGGRDLFVDDGKLQFMVQGNEGDTVQLDDLLPDGTDTGDWIAQNGTVTVAGVEYQVFSHSGEEAEVLIQQGIKTELI